MIKHLLAPMLGLLALTGAWDIDLNAPINARYTNPPNVRTQKLMVNGTAIFVWSRADSVRIVNNKMTVWTRARVDSVTPAFAIRDSVVPRDTLIRRYDTTHVTFYDTIPVAKTSGVDTTHFGADSSQVVWWSVKQVADSTRITKAVSSTNTGLPFGAYALLTSATNPAPLTMSLVGVSASTIISQIADARSKGVRLILAMTGGPHSAASPGCCLSVINGVLQFDKVKWDAVMEKFNTAVIKQGVADAVADGTIIGANVMDEPNVCGAGDGNTWGLCGKMTKLRVDSLCAGVQQIFPTLAAGVAHGAGVLGLEPTKSYRVCQFIMGGVRTKDGTNAQYITGRDSALAIGARDGHAILFNLNVLDGGVADTDGVYDCTGAGQAGKGTFGNHCRMTATQVRDRSLIIGPTGCGLILWKYDSTFWSRADNQQAFRDIAEKLAMFPKKVCSR